MGVCLPSLGISAGANRLVIISLAWERIASIPFSFIYSFSLSFKRKDERNLDFESLKSASSIVAISDKALRYSVFVNARGLKNMLILFLYGEAILNCKDRYFFSLGDSLNA